MNTEIIFNPTKEHFELINNWIISDKTTGNLPTISEGFKRNELIVLFVDKELIGYSVYSSNFKVASIELIEIKSSFRGNGLGRELANNTLLEIKKKEIEVVDLFCYPTNSESFWKKIGFKNFPECFDTEIRMFKPLEDTLDISNSEIFKETIKLWNEEPHIARRKKPKWIWNLSFKPNSRELTKPIIFPVNSDWQISWTKTNGEIKTRKVKYFENIRILFGKFIIIRDLSN